MINTTNQIRNNIFTQELPSGDICFYEERFYLDMLTNIEESLYIRLIGTMYKNSNEVISHCEWYGLPIGSKFRAVIDEKHQVVDLVPLTPKRYAQEVTTTNIIDTKVLSIKTSPFNFTNPKFSQYMPIRVNNDYAQAYNDPLLRARDEKDNALYTSFPYRSPFLEHIAKEENTPSHTQVQLIDQNHINSMNNQEYNLPVIGFISDHESYTNNENQNIAITNLKSKSQNQGYFATANHYQNQYNLNTLFPSATSLPAPEHAPFVRDSSLAYINSQAINENEDDIAYTNLYHTAHNSTNDELSISRKRAFYHNPKVIHGADADAHNIQLKKSYKLNYQDTLNNQDQFKDFTTPQNNHKHNFTSAKKRPAKKPHQMSARFYGHDVDNSIAHANLGQYTANDDKNMGTIRGYGLASERSNSLFYGDNFYLPYHNNLKYQLQELKDNRPNTAISFNGEITYNHHHNSNHSKLYNKYGFASLNPYNAYGTRSNLQHLALPSPYTKAQIIKLRPTNSAIEHKDKRKSYHQAYSHQNSISHYAYGNNIGDKESERIYNMLKKHKPSSTQEKQNLKHLDESNIIPWWRDPFLREQQAHSAFNNESVLFLHQGTFIGTPEQYVPKDTTITPIKGVKKNKAENENTLNQKEDTNISKPMTHEYYQPQDMFDFSSFKRANGSNANQAVFKVKVTPLRVIQERQQAEALLKEQITHENERLSNLLHELDFLITEEALVATANVALQQEIQDLIDQQKEEALAQLLHELDANIKEQAFIISNIHNLQNQIKEQERIAQEKQEKLAKIKAEKKAKEKIKENKDLSEPKLNDNALAKLAMQEQAKDAVQEVNNQDIVIKEQASDELVAENASQENINASENKNNTSITIVKSKDSQALDDKTNIVPQVRHPRTDKLTQTAANNDFISIHTEYTHESFDELKRTMESEPQGTALDYIEPKAFALIKNKEEEDNTVTKIAEPIENNITDGEKINHDNNTLNKEDNKQSADEPDDKLIAQTTQHEDENKEQTHDEAPNKDILFATPKRFVGEQKNSAVISETILNTNKERAKGSGSSSLASLAAELIDDFEDPFNANYEDELLEHNDIELNQNYDLADEDKK